MLLFNIFNIFSHGMFFKTFNIYFYSHFRGKSWPPAPSQAHLHNWSHIREQRVDPAKLRPLPVEALQERRERSLNASLATAVGAGEPGLTTPGRPAGHREVGATGSRQTPLLAGNRCRFCPISRVGGIWLGRPPAPHSDFPRQQQRSYQR